MSEISARPKQERQPGRLTRIKHYFCDYTFLHLMLVPGLIYFLVFKYLPMGGLVMAFKNYNGGAGGFAAIFEAEWVGLQHFKNFVSSMYFGRVFFNTLILSLYRILFGFTAPVILALMLNDVRNRYFKKAVQTITYMPYFLSWVVVAGLLKMLLSPDGGAINGFLGFFGAEPVYFLAETSLFRGILVISDIWKNVGYSSIIYLAAISGIDQQLYEAATIDGAGKIRQIVNITLPSISEIIVIMLILSIGRIMDDNFEQIFNLYSPAVYEVGDVFETYIYRNGIQEGKFSYTAAVGLFKSGISLTLILFTNWISKKFGSEGLI